MNAQDVINNIRSAIAITKEQGHKTASLEALEDLLSLTEKNIEIDNYNDSLEQERTLSIYKAENDRYIADLNNETKRDLEMFNSVLAAGRDTLKSITLINGGAVVVLLAFLGKIWDGKEYTDVVNALSTSILIFSMGVLCAALATGITYITQSAYCYDDNDKRGDSIKGLVIGVVVVSYILFFTGIFWATSAFGIQIG